MNKYAIIQEKLYIFAVLNEYLCKRKYFQD
uniref:Uncharacterized protein n=1 Tax=Myoviridae sp. ctkmZ20 TaxID=2825166 RepID=A0A8S5NT74_9CAUD|nr:MAG TPA: hypothetical protein [Myoviridae sp. ctkmZ20]DAH63232.1 MAG TPA: hypothetical protein [Caudoviricetes sp.]DAO18317.1 MAG TPA: hypothetical protein [Bacteriophage sp.]DAL16264.1 MAG TPA_asm: hypothetical protein [Caudoviricetes sp.]DAP13647.1 MAG TPA: hypothetical protein [Caudoviricetes sp.]